MKKQLVLFLLVLLSVSGFGQEFNLPINNQYISDNPFLISAAYAGIGDCWQARATGFQQWIGIDDAPSTQSLSVDGRIADRTGVGAVLFNDSNGFTSLKGFQGSFAHHITLTDYNRQYLSFGFSYKFNQFEIDSSQFNRSTDIDGDITASNHNVDVSVLYRLGSFFLSLNAINLLDKSLTDFGIQEPGDITTYYAYTGFVIKDDFKDLEYEPSILYRSFSFDTRSSLDLNFKFRKFFREDYVWGGLSLQSLVDQSFSPVNLSPMIGINKSKFYFAYSYQLNLNESIDLGSGGSHLLTIGIDFACKRSYCGCTL